MQVCMSTVVYRGIAKISVWVGEQVDNRGMGEGRGVTLPIGVRSRPSGVSHNFFEFLYQNGELSCILGSS